MKIGAKAMWMQEGVVDAKAAARPREVKCVVRDSCTLRDHQN
jgi:predicted CoA-binding protein